MSTCVEFLNVSKRYDQLTVLDDVSVNCPSAACTAIVGASGSGKTTMLQLVNGVVRSDGGQVKVFGEPVPETGVEQFRRKIGYAVQGAALFPHMSAWENITLVARLQGIDLDEMETRYQQLVQDMDLPEDVRHRLPRELSGGQQQRIGLCRALMLKPSLLLLDEPFSAVDPITRVDIYDRFAYVQKHEGVSSLLVTHDLREAKRLSDYLIILHKGQIQQHGKTVEVLGAPANAYVESLVASQLS
ncbi:MAG: ATP-binding cassette domain-containing protein [Pseudomonadaceae bacterium]|nr:ATP-binding cassette domain-containing protein [Pseudomonadaceae bacterium]